MDCARCRGASVVFSSGSVTFFWDHPFVLSAFRATHALHALRTFLTTTLALFGVCACLLFIGMEFVPIILQNGNPLSLLNARDSISNLFWVSLLTDAWFFSILQRGIEKKRRVLPFLEEQQFEARSKKHRVDIAASFDKEAHRALGESLLICHRMNHAELTPLHLFAALLERPLIGRVISRIALDMQQLHSSIKDALAALPKEKNRQPLPTDDFYSLLMRAYRHAQEAKKHRVDPIDLFTATIDHETHAQQIMEELGIPPQTIENVVAWFNQQRSFRAQREEISRIASLRPRADIDRAMTGRATPLLNSFGVDLTRSAQHGHLFPPVARDEEMESLLNTVGSTTKNIVLVGHAGVGVSTLINGIAYAMVGEMVPEKLKDKRLVSISAGHLASSGNPVAVFQELLDEVLESGTIALVINNLHDFTVRRGMAAFDLAAVLAETVERTGLVVFATSAPAEYHEYLETHPVSSLFIRFDVVEPDENRTIQIVEAHIPSFEHRFPVFFTYDAIAQAVHLSYRYLHDAHNPKKSIDLCEQVALSAHPSEKGGRLRITPHEVEETLEKIAHTKVGAVGRDEQSILLNLEETIHRRMIGQETAVTAVANALRRARLELRETKRPVAVFLFLGPTGVGKTELAKTLADVYFGSEEHMIRLDMSEYQEFSAIERLIGLTGSDVRGGTLTEPVRKNPFSLLLLDELEKASSDVLNLFLQIFEDGRVTDNSGEVIDFTNAIIIATSNAGSQFIQDAMRQGLSRDAIKTRLLEQELKNFYTPEFLNRFDDIITFEPLTESNIEKIARLMIGHVQKQMGAKGITFTITEEALKELARAGYDPEFGARPLRRIIQQRVDDVLAKILLGQKINRRDAIILDVGGTSRIERATHL